MSKRVVINSPDSLLPGGERKEKREYLCIPGWSDSRCSGMAKRDACNTWDNLVKS